MPLGDAPRVTRFEKAYPNPFSDRVGLRFGIPAAGRVRLTIYDLQGRKVADVVDGTASAGWRDVAWNGRDSSGNPVASGAYVARLESSREIVTRKIVLAR